MLTLYSFQASWDKLEEARKESKGLPDQREINESLSFTADVVEAKRKNAKNENEFIYHEAVPELSTIAAVQGANLVNGIGFQVSDEEHAGPDIFARLVPMKAHEASSLYSEEKAKLLRKYGALLEEKDTQLESYMSSLTLDNLNINEEQANKLPQGIVDRCAALNANKTAISDLVEAMSQLAEITADVETNLGEISSMLEAEAKAEREFQSATGVQRTPNAHITELSREFQKYSEAHARAGESNNTLRKAMSLHVNNLKILARPLPEIQQLMPKLSSELNTTEIFRDVKLILNKVNEMKAQRAQFHADLRIAINEDDITGKVIAHGGQEGLQALFATELGKHDKITELLDQNMVAQGNILQALTENYAKAAPVLKTLQDVKQKREHFYSSLAASYDVYEDLLAKSAKGLEFYKKLAGNVQKLLTRFRSARDVQSEERQQRMQSVKAATTPVVSKPIAETTPVPAVSSTPKLRDYLKAKAAMADASNPAYVPTVRPVPVGSENPTQAACSYATAPPNEPPPPYSLTQQQYLDPSAAGYTNPMYQQQQQHIAPPAYKAQASPNSQTLHGALGQMNLQGQSQDNNQAGMAYNYGYPSGSVPPLAYAPPGTVPASSASQGLNIQQPLYVATSGNPVSVSNPSELPSTLQAPFVVNPMSNPYQTAAGYSGQAYQQVNAQAQQVTYPTAPSGYSTGQSAQQPLGYAPSQGPQQQAGGYPQSQTPQQQVGAYQQQPLSGYAQQLTPQQQTGYSQSQAPQLQAPSYAQNQQSTGQAQQQTPQQQQTGYPQTPQQHLAGYAQSQQQATGYPQSQTSQQQTTGYSQSQTPQQPLAYQQQPSGYPQQQQQQSLAPQQPSLYPSQAVQASPQPIPGQQATPPNAGQPLPYPQQYTDPNAAPAPAPGVSSVPSPVPVPTPAPTSSQAQVPTSPHPSATYTSYSNHPGYSFNPQTGKYEYSSGYQQDTSSLKGSQASQSYQFSQSGKQQSVGTTDSEIASRSNTATGFDVSAIPIYTYERY